MSVSSIVYLRDLFPEECFSDQKINGTCVSTHNLCHPLLTNRSLPRRHQYQGALAAEQGSQHADRVDRKRYVLAHRCTVLSTTHSLTHSRHLAYRSTDAGVFDALNKKYVSGLLLVVLCE